MYARRSTSYLKVDLKAIAYNIQNIQVLIEQESSEAKLLCMLKADAYGHGLHNVYRYLYESMGMRHFGLACLEEALQLRKTFKNYDDHLFVFSDAGISSVSDIDVYLDYAIIPVINRLDELEYFLQKQNSIPLTLMVNLGINRMGINFDEIDYVSTLLKRYKRNKVDHLMGHFSSSFLDNKKGQQVTHREGELFNRFVEKFELSSIRVEEKSLANSGAIETCQAIDKNYIRPGLSLYGQYSQMMNPLNSYFVKKGFGLRPAMTLVSQICFAFEMKEGSCVGYGLTPIKEDGFFVYLPLGYADGLSTIYKGATLSGVVNKIEYKFQIYGRVSMDLICLKLLKGDKSYLTAGEEVVFKDNLVSELAHHAKIPSYEVLTSFSHRLQRVYLK